MKKYSIIYADPPWAYRTYSKKGQGRSAESHYPTMCIEDIKALPVGELAAKDCTLFLWITFPCLCEALEVLTAWGFSYKTVAFVWVKQNRRNDDLFTGMGYWTRANAEICILATKGHPKRLTPVCVRSFSATLKSIPKSRMTPHCASGHALSLPGWDVSNEHSYGGNTMLRRMRPTGSPASHCCRSQVFHRLGDGELVGVIIAGRPVSRYLDDGFTLEVTRLCTNK